MKKYAIPALAAALSLAACDQSQTTVEGDEAATPAPIATETTVVTDPAAAPAEGATDEGSSLTIDGGDVDATIDEDGVKAEVKVD